MHPPAESHDRAPVAAVPDTARHLVRATWRRTAAWAIPTAAAGALFDPFLGVGVLAGAAAGCLHLTFLTRDTSRLVLAAHRAAGGRAPANALFLWRRWSLFAVALAAVLWYMRARPEGVAFGVLLALTAFARTTHSHVRRTSTPRRTDHG